jgi:hypothetical protein
MRFLILALTVLIADTVHAFTTCYEPNNPRCPILGEFSDDFEFEMCKGQMDRYRRDVEDYLECLDKTKEATIEEYNRAVKRFNCAAEQQSICF